MKLGIVGSEAAKFTPSTEEAARETIRGLLWQYHATIVVSGGCHLGGIDIWAVQEAKQGGLEIVEFIPTNRTWSGPGGYMQRNLKIAKDSDRVVCITIRTYPENYTGMRFGYCYHCKTRDHVKSGGCWTVKQARQMGKAGEIIVI